MEADMIQITLKESDFENNKFTFSYGNREALFTIVDEEFAGHNTLGRINRMTVLVRKLALAEDEMEAQLCTSVIGVGDGVVGIRSDDPGLLGKLLNKDNMTQCVVELYEDNDTK
jgi:hypothetical protein